MDISDILKIGGVIGGAIVAGLKLISPAKTAYEWVTKPGNKVQPRVVVKALIIKQPPAPEPRPHAKLSIPIIGASLQEWDLYQEYARIAKESYEREQRQKEQARITVSEHELSWNFNLGLINNSEYPAYRLKISSDMDISMQEPIDYTLPLPANQVLGHTLMVTVRELFIGTPSEAHLKQRETVPFNLRVDYENGKGIRFFTQFKSDEPVENQNQFGRTKS